ncbi:MAG: hypothetical protein U5M23_01990 [Marinagarivorans sp.]|nr:hypothetical protein [Marinagarivorans sp.]
MSKRPKPPPIYSNNRYLQALAVHYSVPAELIFKQFRWGAIAFGLGLGLVIYANASLPNSVQQELIVLGGLILGGIGFLIAMLAQMRMMIGRFVRFYLDKDNKPPRAD